MSQVTMLSEELPLFPVLTKVVLFQFRRPRPPLDPDDSARKYLSDQKVISLLGDF